tara:strand:+ start:367 stop:624 length:258 start_codon:yes stop_codon:yes gene_type:complete
MRVFVALFVLTLMVLIVWIRQEGIEVIENFYILALYSILTIIFLGLSINSMLDKKYLNAFIYFILWNVFVIWWFHVGWIGALIYF